MPPKGLHFGWVVLAATFYLNLIVDGYCFVFGIIRLYIQDDYRDYASWMIAIIGGLVPAIYLTFAPICMALNDFLGPTRVIIGASLISTAAFILAWLNLFWRIGFWFDLLMLGIFQGVASALLYGPSIAVVAQYFPPHQRSLAAGITTCGSPVGAIFYSIIIPPLFEAFGWRGSLAIFAGFALNGCVCAMCFLDSLRPKPEAPRHNHPVGETRLLGKRGDIPLTNIQPSTMLSPLSNDEDFGGKEEPCPACELLHMSHIKPKRTFVSVLKTYFNAKLVCQPSFIALLGAAAFSIVGYYVPTLLVTDQSQKPEFRVSVPIQNNLILLWGIFNTIGRAASGRLGDLGIRYAICTSFWIFIIGNGLSALLLLIFPPFMYLGDVSFVTFIVLYGFLIAPLVSMRSVIVSDMYGEENASASFGWFLAIQGVVQLLGFILPTWLDTMSALYAYGFGAACFLVSCVCVVVTLKPFFAMRRTVIAKERKRKAELAALKGSPTGMI